MILFDWFFRIQRKKKRDARIAAARHWPTATAKVLPGVLVDKDELAEGTLAQDQQVEFPYYFSNNQGFFGGHVRTVACSQGEARRLMKQVPEGTPITVRYNPTNPDEVCVLSGDNAGAFPMELWES
jgi:hypothetical protein